MNRTMLAHLALRQRVSSRDRLVARITDGGASLRDELLDALHTGDTPRAEDAIRRNELQVATLAEELRVYQAELHAQADELEASRERTEQALARFTALFLSMPVAALLVDANGELLEHNGQAARLFGLGKPTVAARFMHRYVDRDQFQHEVRPAFHQARTLGSITLDEVVFVGEDGRRFIGELHLAALPVEDGHAQQYAAAVIDRTEHLQDVRALRESTEALRVREAFLAGSARLARVGGWEYEAAGGTMRWSPQLRSVLALRDDEPASLARLLELCDASGRATFVAALHAARPGDPPFDFEIEMRDATGERLRVRIVGDADCGDDGPRVLGVCQDVTSQAQAQQRIGELTERLGVANDAGGIGVWDWDLLRGTLFLDGRMRHLVGLDAEATPQADLVAALAERIEADDLPALRDTVREAVAGGTGFGIELRLAGRERCERWVHLAGRALRDAIGGGVRLVGCAWDTTAEHEQARLVAAKQAAEAANRAKTVFLSRVSHELRTPLNAILGFSQLMRLDADDGDLMLKPQRLAMVEDAARHLLDLVNELLDVSGIESGQLALKRTAFDLRPLVHEALQFVTAQAAALRLTLLDDCAGRPPLLVLGDPTRTREVLLNLLSNAVKYNRPGGSVTVSAVAGDGRVELTVADTGRGMTPEQIGELFQPFSRAGVECSGIPGSGVGLYFSKRVVEAMGGRIGVESVPGERTAFRFELDAAPPADAAN